MSVTVIWFGDPPEKCKICGAQLTDIFIDGRTKYGMWAIMCPTCFEKWGVGTGVGRGQRYERQPAGVWRKTAG